MLQAIYISRITEGGVADRNGKLQVGDKVVSVSKQKEDINLLV